MFFFLNFKLYFGNTYVVSDYKINKMKRLPHEVLMMIDVEMEKASFASPFTCLDVLMRDKQTIFLSQNGLKIE